MDAMSPPTLSPAPARREGLDALRGVSAVLVVMLHAAMPYLLQPMPGLAWPTHDARPSAVVDAIGWAIEGFIMPLFLVLAGLFAAGLCRNLGATKFLKHRTRRLLVPLAFGCVVVVPLDFWVWSLGFLLDGRCTWNHIRRMKFPAEIHKNLFGLSHLWFLQYLYLMCLGLAAWAAWRSTRSVASRAPASGEPSVGSSVVSDSLSPLLWVAPVAGVLWWEPNVVVGFQHSFLPVPAKFVHATLFFLMGVWLDASESRTVAASRFGRWWLIPAAASFVAMLPLIHVQQTAELTGIPRLGFAIAAATFAVAMSWGLYGVFLNVPQCPKGLAYLSEASFWIYLAHHPIVGLAAIAVSRTGWPAELKFAVVSAATVGLTIATYQIGVRYTGVGTVLHGKRKLRPIPPEAETAVVPNAPSTDERRAA